MTLGNLLRSAAATHANLTALCAGERRMSYGDLGESTVRIAKCLLEMGLRPGDRMAIHWHNSIEAVQLYFAAFHAGIIPVPINLRLKPLEIAYIFQHSQVAMCFSAPQLAPLAEEAAAGCPALRRILTEVPAGGTCAALPDIDPDHPAFIIYTSGTTARPKGVVHTHRTAMGCIRGSADSNLLCGGGVSLVMTPMMHIAGLAMVLCAVDLGHTAVLVTFDPAEVLDAIERHRCTYFFVLPALGQFLVEEQIRKPRDVRSLQIVVAGGDSVPVTLQDRFHEHFGFRLQEAYGLTEGGILTFNPADAIRFGSLGRAVPGFELRIVDPTGRELTAGETGEIVAKSQGNCAGYWQDAAATAGLLRGGWLHTGDLACRDEDGYYWFRGRAKQIIVRAGSNVSPQEVEEALYQHPAVREAGVVGKPDPVLGERVVAFVALRAGVPVAASELQAFAQERLADYKTPEEIIFLDELPKGLTGKVDRRTLKGMAREGAVAMAAA